VTTFRTYLQLTPSGTVIHCCLLKFSEKRREFNVIPPQIPLLDKNRSFAQDERGEVSFTPALSFSHTKTRQHFEHEVIRELRTKRPEVFAKYIAKDCLNVGDDLPNRG
jgi:hypothetical protein